MYNFEVQYRDGPPCPADCFSRYVDDWSHRKQIEKEPEDDHHLKDCLFLSITETQSVRDEAHEVLMESNQLSTLGKRRILQTVQMHELDQPEIPENADEIIKDQLTDSFCSNIKDYILDPSRPRSKSMQVWMNNKTLVHGILYQKPTNKYPYHRPVISERKLKYVYEQEHNSPLSGHFGREKTYFNIARNFWMHNLSELIRSKVASCNKCNCNKASTKTLTLPGRKPIGNHPMEVVE